MKTNDIDVSAELEHEFGAKGTPRREAAINHAREEYNAQILLDATRFDNPFSRNTLQNSGSNGNDSGTSSDMIFISEL